MVFSSIGSPDPDQKRLERALKILFLVHDLLTVPLGIAYLSAIVKGKGHEVETVVLTERDLYRTAEEFAPDVIAFGATTGFHKAYLRVNRILKERTGAVSVMGGAHPTFFPGIIGEESSIDYILRGEAEEAFPALLEVIAGERDISTVGNACYRVDGEVRSTPMLPLIENLDSVPYPDRSLLARYGNRVNTRTAFVITGRGCPYDCSYCFNHAYRDLYAGLGGAYRRRSVENVIGEIVELQRQYPKLQMVIFQDDIFIIDGKWVLDFCRQYSERIGIPFHCHLRANLVTKEIATALAGAGCVSIKMAIETADDTLRNEVLRRGMSRETIISACDAVREAGIVLVTQNILGIPTSTLADDLQTLELNLRCRPDFAFATLMQPYPGTRINEYCREKGLLDEAGSSHLPDSFFDGSVILISDPIERNRLRKLFALAIEFRLMRKMLPRLIRTRLDPLYDLADKIWKGYCIKQREFPYRLSLREYAANIMSFFRSRYY
jgi:anaerobic magnesium-protoporphyrin IX monomethyl ester cyclase